MSEHVWQMYVSDEESPTLDIETKYPTLFENYLMYQVFKLNDNHWATTGSKVLITILPLNKNPE